MSIASLIVKIGADITGLRGDVSKATQSLGSLEGAASKVGTVLKALGAAAAVKGIHDLVKGSLEAVDAQAKLSRQLGGTIDGLRAVQLAAGDAGVDSGVLSKAMENLNARLGEAARKGSGEANDALQRLGLSAQELSQMDLPDRMATIADRMQDAGYSTQQTADTLRQLGVRQGEVVRAMLDGGDAFRQWREEVDALGLSLSEVDAQTVERANDAMAKAKLALDAIGQKIAVQLAPLLEVLANEFTELTKSTHGFAGAVDTGLGIAVTAAGMLGDAVRGVHLIFKSAELAGWALGAAVVDVSRDGATAISKMIDAGIDKVNKLIEVMRFLRLTDMTPIALTGDSEFMKGFNTLADALNATVADVHKQLMNLGNKAPPSEELQKWVIKTQEQMRVVSEEAIRTRRALTGGGEDQTEEDRKAEERAAMELEKLRERLGNQLNVLREFAMSEEELAAHKHAKNLETLQAGLEAELLTQAEYAGLSEELDRKHMAELAKIRQRGMEQVRQISVGSVLDGVSQMTSAFRTLVQNSDMSARDMFETNKAFSIADALISGARGVASTLGSYPYPYNLAMAVPHAAMAAAQVAAISSQTFKAGGGTVKAPTAPARASAPAASAGAGAGGGMTHGGGSAGSGQTAIFNIQGENFSRQTVVTLIEQMNEVISDGARLVVA